MIARCFTLILALAACDPGGAATATDTDPRPTGSDCACEPGADALANFAEDHLSPGGLVVPFGAADVVVAATTVNLSEPATGRCGFSGSVRLFPDGGGSSATASIIYRLRVDGSYDAGSERVALLTTAEQEDDYFTMATETVLTFAAPGEHLVELVATDGGSTQATSLRVVSHGSLVCFW